MPASSQPNGPLITDGSINFSEGVNSIKATTVASEENPNGLLRWELSWGVNLTVRDGGIRQRAGWQYLGRIHDGSALYQGGGMYEPDSDNPYLILSIGGVIYKVVPDGVGVTDLSTALGLNNSPAVPQGFWCQGEQFGVWQIGDYTTLPLFWDGSTLRRSIGLATPSPTPKPGENEIPAAGPMDYYQGRLWYAIGRTYGAGDIVRNHSTGTVGKQYRDSILNVTEAPLCFGGDGFTVPNNAGSIRALFHNANINTTLGQGQLLIGTRKAVYAMDVPANRSEWIAATSLTAAGSSDKTPKQTVIQLTNGPVNDRSIVKVNGDVFYQSLEPGIRSLEASVRYFSQWGNRLISANEYRCLQYNDRALLHMASGIEFDNRLLMTALPKQTAQGVVHDALIPMDFIPISSFNESTKPVWEGVWQGLQFLQLFKGDFGGRERAFAVVVNERDGGIDLWELTNDLRTDVNEDGEARVTWQIEFPAYNYNSPFDLKELVCNELWLDKLFGTVHFKLEYRPDGDVCWHPWYEWDMCTKKQSDSGYPTVLYRESFAETVTIPLPPNDPQNTSKRPANLGYQFQPRLTVTGWGQVRGQLLHAEPRGRRLYDNIPEVSV